jgi:hypothetical protein
MRLLIAFVATILLLGCTTVFTSVTPLGTGHYSPKPKDCNILVLTQMPSDRKYGEVSIINAQGNVALDGMLPSLKAKACELGADAIVIKNSTMPNTKEASQAYVVAIKFL